MICARCRYALQCIVSLDETVLEPEQLLPSDPLFDPRGWHTVTHHPTYGSFNEAIAQRCSVCLALWEQLGPEDQHRIKNGTLSHNYNTPASFLGADTLFTWPKRRLVGRATWISPRLGPPIFGSFGFYLERLNDAGEHPITLTDHTRSPETLALAKSWVTECVRCHKRCRTSSDSGSWYPTRLLDLSRVNGAEPLSDQIVYLIETAKVIPAGRYTTVSHRWGPMEQLRLTKDTYPRLTEGVPLGSLPLLMQDVIFVSLELGIHYIWIDLLCVIQDEDSLTDWQHESSLMDKVYSNTFCNISAGDSNGCHESLFSPRDTDGFLPQVVELKVGDDNDERQLFRVYDCFYWYRNVANVLVNKRAWVLQERFLSPRVLQFGKRQVLWECLEMSATDTCPKGIPRELMKKGAALSKNLLPLGQATSPDNVPWYEIREMWNYLVMEYTTYDLTVPSDKLIAISGIAKRVAMDIQEDKYVAGMWL
ncbi:hypothetical protein B0I37DRAFT_2902 [Chaetomium sp. MPI-CAGE-AT-0009]|nr:hypothetical protein B0I37DRAFT_2902 [Chaetomium sp. MPI-CAGE-AT-0009]